MPTLVVPGTCRACGCTEDAACAGGCAWADAERTLCSSCAEGGAAVLDVEAIRRAAAASADEHGNVACSIEMLGMLLDLAHEAMQGHPDLVALPLAGGGEVLVDPAAVAMIESLSLSLSPDASAVRIAGSGAIAVDATPRRVAELLGRNTRRPPRPPEASEVSP